MKYSMLFAGFCIASLAIWNTWSIRQLTNGELQDMNDQMIELEDRVQALSQFQNMFTSLTSTNEVGGQESSDTDDNREVAGKGGKQFDPSHANDRQWQEIDFLKTQRLFHKKLIDQINSDLVKIKRENRETTKFLNHREQGFAAVSISDFEALKRRVSDLYRRIGGR